MPKPQIHHKSLMVRNAHEKLLGADMMMACRLMSEEGVENPVGEVGIDTEATTVAMTWSGVMWRFVWHMVGLTTITVVTGEPM